MDPAKKSDPSYGREQIAGRGYAPWVIRGNLDGRPRALKFALAPRLWAAYDTEQMSLYQAWQEILPLVPRQGEGRLYDIVGPICETGDFLGKDRELTIEPGDLLAVRSSGAYGFTMSSNYNSRPRAAEVMVDGNQAHLIREREQVADLYRGEQPLPE